MPSGTVSSRSGAPAAGAVRDPQIELIGVRKEFGATDRGGRGRVVAVEGADLSVGDGELFAILGPSGSGKTTVLRMIAGFEQPTAGVIRLGGVDVTALPARRRDVNTVFQEYALFPHMTVAQNVEYGMKVRGVPRAERRKRTADALDMVRLTDQAPRRPAQLSGGQRQRVALARALVKKPKLLLLDEPLGALDKKLREATQFELINIQESLGVTFVVVTHDQEEAMTLATRIGVMDRGEIVQVGTPTEIYEYPNSKFVADFIGSVNMFEGRMTEDEPDYVRIETPELPCSIYVNHGISAAPGATVWAAIRPEKIEIAREEPPGTDNRARGVVRDIAYMGDMSIYLVRTETGKMVRVNLPNSVRQLSERISWDEPVWLSWDASSPVVLTQ